MTEKNAESMALKRVPNICFPVAIDIVSRRDVPEHLYDLWGRLSAAQAQGEELSESFVIGMYVKVMQSVGISYNKAQWIHVKTLEEFQDYLIKAKKAAEGSFLSAIKPMIWPSSI